jgi:maltooligosyltrehalose synthase
VEGERKPSVVSFARLREGRGAVVVAPRLVATMMGEDGTTPPLGPEAWGETRVLLPEGLGTNGLRDLLTDRLVTPSRSDEGLRLDVGELFRTLPVALLVDVS